MKILTTTLGFLLLTMVIISCKKEATDVPTTFSIEGKWVGTTGNGGYFGMNIKQGGSLDRFNSAGEVVATGSWQLNGASLSGTYHFDGSGTEVSFTATVNKSQNSFSGSWANDGGEQGTMSAAKQ